MKVPYGLELIENCSECRLRSAGCFCNFSPEVLKQFNGISHRHTYPGGAVLFVEGQTARGAFVLCSGRMKLSTTSREGKVLILRIAEAGEVLGLSAVLSGVAYEVTASAAVPCRVNFIRSDALLSFLRQHGEAGLHAARSVSREYQDACNDIQEILMAPFLGGEIGQAVAFLDSRQWQRRSRNTSALGAHP